MENKELNKKIYFALLDLAKVQFKGLDLPEGHYTANDVYKTLVERLKTEKKEIIYKDAYGVFSTKKEEVYTKESLQKTEFKEINICISSFKCRIKNALGLFQALSGYEKFCGYSGTKAYIFQVEKEESGKIVDTVTFEIPTSKEWNVLKKCAADDGLRPVVNCIFADAENKNLVSSNGKVLYICHADISGDRNISIPLDICKKLKSGKVTVTIYEETEKEKQEEYTNNGVKCLDTFKIKETPVKVENNGVSYTFNELGRFPNYKSVCDNINKGACIDFNMKEFEKDCKVKSKFLPKDWKLMQIQINNNDNKFRTGIYNPGCNTKSFSTFDINNHPEKNILFCIDLDQFLKFSSVCANRMYYTDNTRPLYFDAVNNGTILLIPKCLPCDLLFEELHDNSSLKYDTPALERFEKYGYDTYMKPKKKAKAKKVSIITNEEKEAAKPAKDVETVEPEKPSFDYSKAAKNIVNGIVNKNTLLVLAYKGLNEQLQRNEETKAVRPKETAVNGIKNEAPDDRELETTPKYNDSREPEKNNSRVNIHIKKEKIIRFLSSIAAALIIFLCGWMAGSMTKDTSAKAQKVPIPATFRIYEPARVVHKANKPQTKAVNTLKVQKHINYNVKLKKPLKTNICKNDDVTAKVAIKRMQPDSIRITDTNLHPDVLPGACINDSVNNIVVTINFKN